MGAVVADAWSVASRCRTRDIESRCDLWAHGDGVGRVEHDGRLAPRVASRNDHDVGGWKGEALVDATVLRILASNVVKPEFAAGRKIEGSRPKCDGHFARPPTPGSFSPRGLVFLEGRPRVFVEKHKRLPASDEADQCFVDARVEHRTGKICHPLDRLFGGHLFLIWARGRERVV